MHTYLRGFLTNPMSATSQKDNIGLATCKVVIFHLVYHFN